jgi:hypothetical protein
MISHPRKRPQISSDEDLPIEPSFNMDNNIEEPAPMQTDNTMGEDSLADAMPNDPEPTGAERSFLANVVEPLFTCDIPPINPSNEGAWEDSENEDKEEEEEEEEDIGNIRQLPSIEDLLSNLQQNYIPEYRICPSMRGEVEPGYFTKQFPLAASVVEQGNSHFRQLLEQQKQKGGVYSPFTSTADWSLAQWMHMSRVSQSNIDKFVKTEYVSYAFFP